MRIFCFNLQISVLICLLTKYDTDKSKTLKWNWKGTSYEIKINWLASSDRRYAITHATWHSVMHVYKQIHAHTYIHICMYMCTYPFIRIFVMAVDSCGCSRGALKRALISSTCGVRLSGVRRARGECVGEECEGYSAAAEILLRYQRIQISSGQAHL